MPNIIDGSKARLTPRQRRVLEIVEQSGFATIESLAQQFEVSGQSIRRDINRLQEENYLQRFRGGAGLVSHSVRVGYAQKLSTAPKGKEKIGQAVADLIPEGASVYLDVGTTVEAVARSLLRKGKLRIFTCSAAVAMILGGQTRFEVVVVGGTVRGANGSLVGSLAVQTIGMFRFDWAVIGCSGFDEDGAPMDFDLEKIAVRQAALAQAKQSIVVADGTKFEKSGVGRIAPLSAIGTCVVDADPPGHLDDRLRAAEVRLIVAR